MRNYFDAIYEKNKNLKKQIEKVNQKIAVHAINHIDNFHTRSTKISNLFMFSSDDRIKINSFLYLIKDKIEKNFDYFTATTKIQIQFNLIRYVYFCFERIVFRQIFNLINYHIFVHVNDFLN